MEERIAKLEANVEHIQSDVSDIKIDIRRLNDKVDGMDQRLSAKIDAVDQRLSAKIDNLDRKLSDKIDAADQRQSARYDSLRDSISKHVTWAIGLYIGLAASLFAMIAHGFHWI